MRWVGLSCQHLRPGERSRRRIGAHLTWPVPGLSQTKRVFVSPGEVGRLPSFRLLFFVSNTCEVLHPGLQMELRAFAVLSQV